MSDTSTAGLWSRVLGRGGQPADPNGSPMGLMAGIGQMFAPENIAGFQSLLGQLQEASVRIERLEYKIDLLLDAASIDANTKSLAALVPAITGSAFGGGGPVVTGVSTDGGGGAAPAGVAINGDNPVGVGGGISSAHGRTVE